MHCRSVLALTFGAVVGLAGTVAAASSTSTSTEQKPKANQIQIHELSGPITVDGQVDEAWSGLGRPIPVRFNGPQPDASDLSAQAYAGWTDSDLYLAFAVHDSKAVDAKKADDIYKNDAVDFWIGPNLWFTAGLLDDGKAALSVTNLNDWLNVDTSNVQLAAKRTSDGYVVELAIPAALVKEYAYADLASGQTFKLAFGVIDADDDDASTYLPSVKSLYYPVTYGWNNDKSYADAELVA